MAFESGWSVRPNRQPIPRAKAVEVQAPSQIFSRAHGRGRKSVRTEFADDHAHHPFRAPSEHAIHLYETRKDDQS